MLRVRSRLYNDSPIHRTRRTATHSSRVESRGLYLLPRPPTVPYRVPRTATATGPYDSDHRRPSFRRHHQQRLPGARLSPPVEPLYAFGESASHSPPVRLPDSDTNVPQLDPQHPPQPAGHHADGRYRRASPAPRVRPRLTHRLVDSSYAPTALPSVTAQAWPPQMPPSGWPAIGGNPAGTAEGRPRRDDTPPLEHLPALGAADCETASALDRSRSRALAGFISRAPLSGKVPE